MNTSTLEKDVKNLYYRLGIITPFYELDMQEICHTLSISLIFWENSSKACTKPDGKSYIFINARLGHFRLMV
ncbi:hypothetical protein [Listeria ilorinensis]|uniref:hypothetical protein n=1 Tax=Listeria ilorinensis TaxID=2867439 RepID=UPI001EF52341|nr:hypothetical protein [Listeria ilorinensis]